MSVFSFRRLFPSNLTTNSRPAMLVAAAVVAFSATGAMGDIVSVGGNVVLYPSGAVPANIQNGQWSSNSEVRAWFERQTVLTSNLSVNHANPGRVDDASLLVPATISAGTAVQSYMVRFDPGGNNGVTRSGFVIFNTPILGLLTDRGPLIATDSLLGLPSVTQYNTNNNRGMEPNTGEGEYFQISADRLRLDFSMTVTNQPTDDIRVVTAIPSPSAAALFGLGGLMAARRRR
jgi:hypothetical protein